MSVDCLLKKINTESGEIESQFKYDASVKSMITLPSGEIIMCLGDGNVECCAVDGSLTRHHCFQHYRVTSTQCTPDEI
jgi:hypothetical protein